MPTWAKVLLILTGVALVLIVGGGFLGYRWLTRTYENLERGAERATATGEALGRAGTLETCVEELVRRSARSESPMALMAATPFAWGCLEAAPYDGRFCSEVPDVQNERALLAWANDRCGRYGAPGNEICRAALTPVASFCTAQNGR
jgi:hypothetical protein